MPTATPTSPDPGRAAAPLIVLGGPRTGSSAFTGLLAAAGLHLGPVAPPSPGSPRGSFENVDVVAINEEMLRAQDRDWTCPSPALDHRSIDLAPLEGVVESLRSEGRPWGVKDPRLLFTLPAWAQAAGTVRLVGVHRNTGATAASLAACHCFPLERARAIAVAYAERLAAAHRRLRFPLVSFDAGDTFVDRTRRVAELLGLAPDAGALAAAYDASLVRHHAEDEHPADAYLAAAAAEDVFDVPVYTAAAVVDAWELLPPTPAAELVDWLGPAFEQRRAEMSVAARDILPDVGRLATLRVEPGDPAAGEAVVTLEELLEDGHAEAERWSHLLGPSLLDHVPPGDLGDVLAAAARRFDARGVLVVDGWVTDGVDLPESLVTGAAGVPAHRGRYPYLHHREEVEVAALRAHLAVVDVVALPSGRTRLTLSNDATLRRSSALPAADLRGEVASLSERVEELSAQLADTMRQQYARNRELMSLRQTADDEKARRVAAEGELRRIKRDFDRLARRRSVRLSLAVARLFRPLFREVRRFRSTPETPVVETTSARDEIVAAIRSLRPARHPTDGPQVSIIILTRDGEDHLQRLLPALERTHYKSFEVIVVDNGSTDGTTELLEQPWGYSLRTIRNEHNTSFSDGNNAAAALAAGELLLFLNNDLEPITDDWLGAMVTALSEDPGRAAVGALLIYPENVGQRSALSVQHRGVAFGFRNGAPHAQNIRADDATDPSLVDTVEVPAVTAAALLVSRQTFDEVSGFDSGYVYGCEDIDLCLRLRRKGTIVVAGEAALFHYESATQRAAAKHVVRVNRIGNWQLYAETWAPTITRSVRRDQLLGAGRWAAVPGKKVAITLTRNDMSKGWGDYYTAHELGDAMAEAGWEVLYAERYQDRWDHIPEDVGLVISLLDSYDVRKAPPGAVTVAWVRNWVERWMSQPWFEHFDAVATSSHMAAEAVRAGSRHQPVVVPLATNPEHFHPGPASPTFRADYAFTGNNWGVGRDIIPLLDIRPGEKFLLFGKNWDQYPQMVRYWRGHLSYDLLPEVYRSADIVLDDTAGPTLPHGFVNGRVFDALASGALVLSDNATGSEELFGGRLPTYGDGAELRALLDRYLGDEGERRSLAAELRSIVVENHTYRHRAEQFPALALAAVDTPRFAVKIGAPHAETAHQWGDYHFAHSLVRAMGRHGFAGEVHLLPDWDDVAKQNVDIVIHLRGLSTYTPKRSHVNVLWVISHPDDVTLAECEKYDVVCVASESLAARLASELDRPVFFLPQCTDADRFGTATPDPELATQVLFVGNSRRRRRDAIDWALAKDLPLTVYGSDWEGMVPPHQIRDTYFPNERLGSLYASAGVVLNDHWPDMRREGIVSNRVFDALASGAVVLSDDVEGLDTLFDGAVPTYSSADDLAAQVERYLEDEDFRLETIAKARHLVLEHHTFDRRAEQLTELIRPLLAGREMDCDGNLFAP